MATLLDEGLDDLQASYIEAMRRRGSAIDVEEEAGRD
jgi:hypothetical protein